MEFQLYFFLNEAYFNEILYLSPSILPFLTSVLTGSSIYFKWSIKPAASLAGNLFHSLKMARFSYGKWDVGQCAKNCIKLLIKFLARVLSERSESTIFSSLNSNSPLLKTVILKTSKNIL